MKELLGIPQQMEEMLIHLRRKISITEKETQECKTNILRVIPIQTNIIKTTTPKSQITILLLQIPMVHRQITIIEGVTLIVVISSEDDSRAKTRRKESNKISRDISQKSIRMGHPLIPNLFMQGHRDQTRIRPKNRTKFFISNQKRLIRKSSQVSLQLI